MGYLDLQLEKVASQIPELMRLSGANNLWTRIKSTANYEPIGELNFRMPAITSMGHRMGAWSSAGTTESIRGGSPTTRQMTGTFIGRMWAAELSDRDMRIFSGNNVAVQWNVFERLMNGFADEVNLSMECEMFSDGVPVCFRATNQASVSGNTVYTGDNLIGARFMRPGMEVTVLDSTGSTVKGVTVILQTDLMAKTFTCTGLIAGAATTDIVVYGRYATGNPAGVYGLQFWGSDASTGTTLTVNRATDETIRATRVAMGGALNQSGVLLLTHRQQVRLGQGMDVNKYTGIVPMHVQAEVFIGANSTQSLQRVMLGEGGSGAGSVDRMSPMATSKSFTWAGGRVHDVSQFQPNGRIDYPNWDDYTIVEMTPLGWFSENVPGSESVTRVRRVVGSNGLPTTRNWVAMTWEGQVFNLNPGRHGYITGITVDAGYTAF